jgi:hypothetical protein
MATRTTRSATAAVLAAACTVGGVLALGRPAHAAPPPQRVALVAMDCTWTPNAVTAYSGKFAAAPEITFTVSPDIKAGDTAELRAAAADGKMAVLPAKAGGAHNLAYTGAKMAAESTAPGGAKTEIRLDPPQGEGG